jgi:hypothetical protein
VKVLNQYERGAIGKQAESEPEKRAKIAHASGDLEAGKPLTEAAQTLRLLGRILEDPRGAAPFPTAGTRPRKRAR